MLITSITLKLRPEHRDEFLKAASRMTEESRAEPGCINYRFSIDLVDPNTIYLHEEWESEEDVQRHLQTPGFLAIQQKLPAMVAAPPSIKHFHATEAHSH
jgi:quinol monooxygenase YgiN